MILLDSLSKNQNKKIILALSVYPIIMLNDNDILTILLSGGFFILLMTLFSSDIKSLNKK